MVAAHAGSWQAKGGRIGDAQPLGHVKQYGTEISSRAAANSPIARRCSLPDDRQLVLRVMPMPADANGNGDIFGGWIMAQVDLAGAVLPARIAKGRIATVAVNQFVFKQPVSIGDLLSFYAKVERIGNTSVTVQRRGLRRAQPGRPARRQGDRGQPDLRRDRPRRPAAANPEGLTARRQLGPQETLSRRRSPG